MLDVLIIGAGPIGLACGIEAEKRGLNYQIVEKGCLVNSIYRYPVNMTFFSTSELLEIGDVPFVSHNPKPTRNEALEYYRRVAQKWKLQLCLYKEVKKVKPSSDGGYSIELVESEETGNVQSLFFARAVVLATGFYDIPQLLQVPGEGLSKVKHYYDDPHLYANRKVAVIGAANSAIDAALETYRKGADVSLIVRGSEISKRVKYWVKPDIDNRIKEGSIQAFFNAEVKEITPESLVIEQEGEEIILENDHVLAMTGYLPNFKFLAQIGIEEQDAETKVPVYDAKTHETNLSNIYLAGVVCGGRQTSKWFIENSRSHAVDIMEDIAQKKLVATTISEVS